MRRFRIFALAAALAASVSACGGDGRGPDRREAGLFMEGLGGRGMVIRPGPSANQAYSDGMDLRRRGDCAGAIAKLTPVANLGPGYENAQYALGDCLIATAAAPETSQYRDGLVWLIRAADGGWTEAHGRLAQIYALGPEDLRNLDEAALRLALYRAGAALARLGFTPLDPAVERAVAAAVGAERLAAVAVTAATWQPKIWVPPRSPEPPGPEMRGQRRAPQPLGGR
jgi:hypothetical protein